MNGYIAPNDFKPIKTPKLQGMHGFFDDRPAMPTSPPVIPRMSPQAHEQPGYMDPYDGSTNKPMVVGSGYHPAAPPAPLWEPQPAHVGRPEFSIYTPDDQRRLQLLDQLGPTGAELAQRQHAGLPLAGSPPPPPAAAAPSLKAGLPAGFQMPGSSSPDRNGPTAPSRRAVLQQMPVPENWEGLEQGGMASTSPDVEQGSDMVMIQTPGGGTVGIPRGELPQMLGLISTGRPSHEVSDFEKERYMESTKKSIGRRAAKTGSMKTGEKFAAQHPEKLKAAQARISEGQGTYNDYWLTGQMRTQDSDFGTEQVEAEDAKYVQGRGTGVATKKRVRNRKKTRGDKVAELNAANLDAAARRFDDGKIKSKQDREDTVAARDHGNRMAEIEAGKADPKPDAPPSSQLKSRKYNYIGDDGKNYVAEINYTFNPKTGETEPKHTQLQKHEIDGWKKELQQLAGLEAQGVKRAPGKIKGRKPLVVDRAEELNARLMGYGVAAGGTSAAAKNATPAAPKTKADYDALPAGTRYVDPKSGKVATKKG